MRILVVKGPLAQEQLTLLRACARLEVEIKVVGFSGARPGKWWSDPADEDALVERLTPVRLSNWHIGWLYRGFRPVVEEFDPDLIHVVSEPWGLLVGQALRTRRPVVAHGAENQSYVHGAKWEGPLRKGLARRYLRQLSGFASWNHAGIGLAHGQGLPGSVPTLVAPAAVSDPAPFLEAARHRDAHRSQFGMDDRIRYVGFVGRLAPQKGLADLIDAIGKLGRDDVELVVAGAGPARRDFERQARSIDVKVNFLGLVPLSDIPEVMSAVDLMIVPSVTTPEWSEQFGRVAVEAMFAGTPLITSSCGALPEVVGDSALIVPERSPKPLAEAIERLLNDSPFSTDLADSAREQALRRFHPDALAGMLVRFWSEVVSGAHHVWTNR